MKEKTITKVGLIELVIILAIFGINSLSIINLLSIEFIKSILIVSAFSAFGIGFTAFQIEESKKYKKLGEDMLNAGIISIISLFSGIIYLSNQNIFWGFVSITSFTLTLIYFLTIIFVARLLWNKKSP